MWKKGLIYEELVANRLKEKGWNIVARNVRFRGSELDLIAQNADRLICVEVKARRTIPDPSVLLTTQKVKALSRGLHAWLSRSHDIHLQSVEVWLCCIAIERELRWIWFNITDMIETEESLQG